MRRRVYLRALLSEVFPQLTVWRKALNEQTPWDEYTSAAWLRTSLAVVACDGHGTGCVIWTAGPHVRMEIEEYSSVTLAALGLDDAPHGISVWEGRYDYHDTSHPLGPDEGCEATPKGSFRSPTADEWKAICEDRCPWNDADWRVGD